MSLTHLERKWKAQQIWRDRDALIDLRLEHGEKNGRDLTYLLMTQDIELLALEAEALEHADTVQGAGESCNPEGVPVAALSMPEGG